MLNSAIPLQVRRKPVNHAAELQAAMGIKQAQSQMKTADAKAARNEALRLKLAEAGGDRSKMADAHMTHGDPKTGLAFEKAGREAEAHKWEQGKAEFERVGRMLGSIVDGPSYARVLAGLPPEVAATMPPQYDEGFIRQQQLAFMDGKTKFDIAYRERSLAQDASQHADSIATTRRGQDMRAQTTRATAAKSAASDARKIQLDTFKSERDLRREAAKATKDFGTIRKARKQIDSALRSASKSSAATLTAATSFMKLLDPGSVVRESELGMALQTSGAIDRATNYVSRLTSGKVLTPRQVRDFKAIVADIYDAAESINKSTVDEFRGHAEAYGLNPDRVVKQYKLDGSRTPKAPPSNQLPRQPVDVQGWDNSMQTELDELRQLQGG